MAAVSPLGTCETLRGTWPNFLLCVCAPVLLQYKLLEEVNAFAIFFERVIRSKS